MKLHSSGSLGSHNAPILLLFLLALTFPTAVTPIAAQTTQPFLFAGTYDTGTKSSGFVTLLRNSSTGALSLLANTAVSFKDPCYPVTMDPTGHFLFGVCGEGLAMYTLDATTGIVTETPTSPYSASVSTGQAGVLVVAESSGQYVYLLKVAAAQPPLASSFTLDSFRIDPATPSLVAANSQSLSLNGTWVDAAGDPSQHGMFIYVNQDQGGPSPVALLYPIPFDSSSGLPQIPSAGLNIGSNARSLAMSPSGGYLAMGWGDTMGTLTIYQFSGTNLNLTLIGSVDLGLEDGSYGSYSFPDALFFSPGGNLLYVQAPPANFSGGTSLPFLVFNPTTVTPLATPPIFIPAADFLNGLMDPQAPFSYVGNSGPTTYGISVYQIDLSSGLPSQPPPISAPFFPQLDIAPLFAPIEPGGQGIQSPTLGITPATLTFPSTEAGQSSGIQYVLLKSLGTESVSLSSIQISGSNATDFIESDNCMTSPVLPTDHSCTVAVTYAPASVGTSQATLFVTDNAAGSPQSIALSGTATAPPPPAPAVTLNPASTLNFPGTPALGTSTAPQPVTLTNSGNAPLQISSVVLGGSNLVDFSISSNNCSGTIAANASCAVSIVFSPLAVGLRTATLIFSDNAANSPQTITLNGTAVASPPPAPAVTLTPSSSLNFPGVPVQGTSTSPQTVTLTNSGNAPLQISAAFLSGANATDFTLSSNNCSGAIAANASCSVAIVFSPSATGIRSALLTFSDNAANSPQSLTVGGTAAPAVSIVASAGGFTTSSVIAGQPAQYNFQAVAGAGFTGTLTFTCSGAPFGASCTVPTSLPVSGGRAIPFSVSVTTLGASNLLPFSPLPSPPAWPRAPFSAVSLLAALCVLLLSPWFLRDRLRMTRLFPIACATTISILLVFSGIGCSGGGAAMQPSSSSPQSAATPVIQPSGGTFTSGQSVSIGDATSGSTIYYTLDGSVPSASSPV